MSDFNREDKAHRDMFDALVNGTVNKTQSQQLSNGFCEGWERETLLKKYSPEDVDVFFAKLECYKDRMDVSNIAIFDCGNPDDDLQVFFKDAKTQTWTQNGGVLEQLVYDIRKRATSGDIKQVLDYAKYDRNSNALRFSSYATRCIPVGSRWFDFETGTMVDENLGDGINFFGFTKDIELTSVSHVKDCTSYLVTSLRDALGCEVLNYILNCIAYNLPDLNIIDRVFLVIIGASRSGKGTLIEALKRVGICPTTDFASDLNSSQQYRELTAQVMSHFPVAGANEVNTLNFEFAKALCSDASASFNRKFQSSVSVPLRAMVIATANQLPPCSISGVANKIIIIRTQKSYLKQQNPNYWQDVEKEGYDEFISLLLNKAYRIKKDGWTPARRPDEIIASIEEAKRHYMCFDSFFENWEPEGETSLQDAYAQALLYANDSTSDWESATYTANHAATQARTQANPVGHYGISYNNFKLRFVALNNVPYRKAQGVYVKGHFPQHLLPPKEVKND